MELSRERLLQMYGEMYRIRKFELKVGELFLKGLIPGTIHLYHGEEAVAVGAVSCLRKADKVMLTHRPHGHAIAKGMDMGMLMAEILGRIDGCSRGIGGSMHLADVEKGIMPTLPIIGAGIPIAAGIAFYMKQRKTEDICMAFFGDGTTNIGAFHEGMNLAAIWKLPVVYVCENNLYAVSTPIRETCLLQDLSKRAEAYGMPGITVDGNDVEKVHFAVKEAVDRARRGEGPTLVECKTYRQGGHSRTDPGTYRSKQEVDEWLERDPLLICKKALLERGYASPEECAEMENSEDMAVEEAARFAMDSEHPIPGEEFFDEIA